MVMNKERKNIARFLQGLQTCFVDRHTLSKINELSDTELQKLLRGLRKRGCFGDIRDASKKVPATLNPALYDLLPNSMKKFTASSLFVSVAQAYCVASKHQLLNQSERNEFAGILRRAAVDVVIRDAALLNNALHGNNERYKSQFSGDGRKYVITMSNTRSPGYGSRVEVRALATVLNCEIHIYHKSRTGEYVFSERYVPSHLAKRKVYLVRLVEDMDADGRYVYGALIPRHFIHQPTLLKTIAPTLFATSGNTSTQQERALKTRKNLTNAGDEHVPVRDTVDANNNKFWYTAKPGLGSN